MIKVASFGFSMSFEYDINYWLQEKSLKREQIIKIISIKDRICIFYEVKG